MKLKEIPKVPDVEEIIESCIERAKKRRNPEQKIQIVGDRIYSIISRILESFPRFSDLNEFYKELIECYFKIEDIRKALAALDWIRKKVRNLKKRYIRMVISNRKRGKEIRKEFYGRVFSILRDFKEEFEFLENVRKFLRELPVIKDYPTVVIFGFPNVGKSTILRELTGSEVEIASYPFTTKKILIGYFEEGGKKIQVIDTPGVLDRKRKNAIEKQALIALKYLADVIVYVFDPSETCGYLLENQIKLYNLVKRDFEDKLITVANKKDLPWREDFKIDCLKISALEKEGIEELRRKIIEKLKEVGKI